MANLYADENFRFSVVRELRLLGHDVPTASEAGKANKKISDADVLALAIRLGRAVLTFNRRHFIKLHKKTPQHKGIVVCTVDKDSVALGKRIDQEIRAAGPLENMLIRVNRPHMP